MRAGWLVVPIMTVVAKLAPQDGQSIPVVCLCSADFFRKPLLPRGSNSVGTAQSGNPSLKLLFLLVGRGTKSCVTAGSYDAANLSSRDKDFGRLL